MVSVLGVFLAIFVFSMTVAGISAAIGPVGGPSYDILAAAQLLQSTYLKAFNVPEAAAAPLSYLLMTIPGVLSFFVVKTIFSGGRE